MKSGLNLYSGRRVLSVRAAALALVVLAACQAGPPSETEKASATPADPAAATDPVAHGKFLVTLGGCNDCHTPLEMGPNGPAPDMSRMLSGHPQDMQLPPPPAPQGPWQYTAAATMTAWSGPWGISYTANLTPDTTSGLGSWSEDMFIQSIRSGKHMGTGRPIMPPMPWQAMAKLSDQDLKDIYAYLRTIPAIHNEVPPYQPPAAAPAGGGGE